MYYDQYKNRWSIGKSTLAKTRLALTRVRTCEKARKVTNAPQRIPVSAPRSQQHVLSALALQMTPPLQLPFRFSLVPPRHRGVIALNLFDAATVDFQELQYRTTETRHQWHNTSIRHSRSLGALLQERRRPQITLESPKSTKYSTARSPRIETAQSLEVPQRDRNRKGSRQYQMESSQLNQKISSTYIRSLARGRVG